MSEQINILHVVGQLNRGGAELRLLDLMRYVDRRKYRFHFCCLSGRSGSLDEEVRQLGGKVHLLRRGPLGFPRRFRTLLRRHHYQVVEAHVLYYSGLVLRLAAQCGVPVRAALLRNSQDARRCGPVRAVYHRVMRRLIDRHATHLAAVSRGAMTAVWGQRWDADPRCQVIYNGLGPARLGAVPPAARDTVPPAAKDAEPDSEAVRREFGVPAGATLYVHVGTIRQSKNHARLLSIFARLLQQELQQGPSARLLLIGRGGNALARRLRRQAARLGIVDRVVFCGERSDVPRLLAAADAMIFPSLWEGLPGAVLEASAAGVPVLASDLPGVREIAAWLPQVRCLSLEADDATWAEAARELTTVGRKEDLRRAARRAFAESPFTIDRSATHHCRIWRGENREPAIRRAA